jgi:diguanylate cyclase (GGDEF)-like protein
VYDELLEKVMAISEMNMGWISIKEKDRFELKSARGISLNFKEKIISGEFDSILSDVLETEEPLYVLENDDIADAEVLRDEGIAFLAVIPLRYGGEAIGAFTLANRMEIKFDFDLASLLSLIGNNLSLITEKIMLFQETQRLSMTDPLTGLHNMRHFYGLLESEVARTRRYYLPFSLILFDIDNFKAVNDSFGHQAGDEVLISVSKILVNTSREADTVARYGGEEFITLLPNTPKDEAYKLGMRIKDEVERHEYLGSESVKITLSGGVASCPDDANDAKSLLYAADMAMYDAKMEGKSRICHYKKR